MSVFLRIRCDGILVRDLPAHYCNEWVGFEAGTMREGQVQLKKLGWTTGRGVFEHKGKTRRLRLDWCPKCTKLRALRRQKQ